MPSISSIASLVVALLAAAPSTLAGKRGLAWPWYNEGSNLDETKLANGNGNVNWMYNWETWRPANTANVNWIGTQATKDSQSSPISQLQTRAAQQGWNTVFSLNEPDLNSISPGDAATWYIQNINPLAIKKAIPSVSSSQNAGQGLDWAAQFISACAGRCYFDYVNIHWYGNSFSEFQSHVQNAHNRFPSYKLVVSEFALKAPASRDQQVAFLKQAMSFLDGASYVTMYAVFGASSPSRMQGREGWDQVGAGASLFNDDGSLTANGIAYRG
ncbi:glycoside hydrolase family 128 protein [Ceratobasidium sp. AG-Ba]|nr:glycoside hydrolase family 128 protein [Ceratobasidium sp. AG-Ba]